MSLPFLHTSIPLTKNAFLLSFRSFLPTAALVFSHLKHRKFLLLRLSSFYFRLPTFDIQVSAKVFSFFILKIISISVSLLMIQQSDSRCPLYSELPHFLSTSLSCSYSNFINYFQINGSSGGEQVKVAKGIKLGGRANVVNYRITY